MNLKTRVSRLENKQENSRHLGPVILVFDIDDEGQDAALSKWELKNGPAPENALIIFVVPLKKES